MKQTTRGW